MALTEQDPTATRTTEGQMGDGARAFRFRVRRVRPRRGRVGRPYLAGRRRSRGWFYVAPALAVFAVFVAYPLVDTVYSSLLDWDGISGVKQWVAFANYHELFFEDPAFWSTVENTLEWLALTVPAQLLLGLAFALILDQRFHGRGLFRTVFFLPVVLSSTVIVFAWNWIYDPDVGIAPKVIRFFGGEGESWLGHAQPALIATAAVSVWRVAGFFMIFFLAGMQMIPNEYYEAAKIDGATWWQRTLHVTLPGLKPMLTLMLMFGVINALRDFDLIWILTRGGPAYGTQLLSLEVFDQAFNQSRPGYAAAVSVVLLAVTAASAALLLFVNSRATRDAQ